MKSSFNSYLTLSQSLAQSREGLLVQAEFFLASTGTASTGSATASSSGTISTATTGRSVSTAATSTSTSSSSSTAAALVSKGEVDVGDFLLPVGSLKVDDRFLFLLLALFFILLLVDRGLLPLGINVGALSGLPDVELGSIFLGLLSLPLVQGEGLGLLRLLLLLLHGAVLLGL